MDNNVQPKWTKPRYCQEVDPLGELSNFSPQPIELDGRTWPTNEHYFQAQKFVGTVHEEAIRLADSPGRAAQMGRSREFPLRADWEAVKDDIMRKAVRAKFTQHPAMRELLLSTGEALLVDHTKEDRYWGDGGDGSGLNRLGKILMEVRAELKSGRITQYG